MMASAEREPIYEGLGSLPPVGFRNKAPGQGGQDAKPPEADDNSIIGYTFSALRMHSRHTYEGSTK
jgi:hypothetical protein